MYDSITKLEKSYQESVNSSKFELKLIDKSNQILIDNLQGRNILELGCGLGYTTKILVQKNCEITCIEHSNHFIEITKEKLSHSQNTNFINSKWEAFNTDVEFSDIILFRGLDCVEDLEITMQFLKNISKKSTIHIVVTNTKSYHRIASEKLGMDKTDALTTKAKSVGRLQNLNYEVMLDLFNNFNFEIHHFEGIGFKIFSNEEMDKETDKRMDVFVEMGKDAGVKAAELYFKIKSKY